MYAATSSIMIIIRKCAIYIFPAYSYNTFSMLQPFWPTGSGCARGFLSSMDACWAVRSWGSGVCSNPLQVLAERESIYRLLNQTTPENLSRDIANYMLDPHTRYTNLNSRAVLPVQVKNLYFSDDPVAVEQCLKSPSSSAGGDHSKKRRRRGETSASKINNNWASILHVLISLQIRKSITTFCFHGWSDRSLCIITYVSKIQIARLKMVWLYVPSYIAIALTSSISTHWIHPELERTIN